MIRRGLVGSTAFAALRSAVGHQTTRPLWLIADWLLGERTKRIWVELGEPHIREEGAHARSEQACVSPVGVMSARDRHMITPKKNKHQSKRTYGGGEAAVSQQSVVPCVTLCIAHSCAVPM